MTPRSGCARPSRSVPSVFPSRTATGAWQFTQKVPRALLLSRWARWFMARNTGSSVAYACMLPAQSWYCAGWQVRQVSGSMSALWDSVVDPEPEPQPAMHGDAQRDEGNMSQHLHCLYEVCSSAPRVSQFDREPATAFEGRCCHARAGVIRVQKVGRRVHAAARGGLSRRRRSQLRGRRAPHLPDRLRQLPRPGRVGSDRPTAHQLPANLQQRPGGSDHHAKSSTTVRCRQPTRPFRWTSISVRPFSSGSPAVPSTAQPSTPVPVTSGCFPAFKAPERRRRRDRGESLRARRCTPRRSESARSRSPARRT